MNARPLNPVMVRVAAETLLYHGGALGPRGETAMAMAIEAAERWQEQAEARARGSHARDEAGRRASVRTIRPGRRKE